MSIHSNDRVSGKTKLERLGKRAMCDKDTVFNNLGHLIDETLLIASYQELDRSKAVGIDGETKGTYGSKLYENIQSLIHRIHTGTYKPKPARIVEIPKEDGSTRPLVISCFEDKLVQSAVNKILTAIYEPVFLNCSYGFRPNKNCHDALRALTKHTYPFWDGAVVEIDIKKCFNTIPHKELHEILKKKISDSHFLKLISKLVNAPIIVNGEHVTNKNGCPQGSIISPILANIFLHEVIDLWFLETCDNHLTGAAKEVRYADDMVFAFQKYLDAKRFFKVLPKRLQKYGLKMHETKSNLIKSGQNAARAAYREGTRLPTYQFLGFTVYWGLARNQKWWRMKYTSRRDRLNAKLNGLSNFLRKELNSQDTVKTLNTVKRVMIGWLNYHSISDNERRVNGFIRSCRWIILKWINRRGRKRPMNWTTLLNLLDTLKFPRYWKTTSMFT